jgi:perosamine synthetase
MKNQIFNWRFSGNEKKYLNDILKTGLKPKRRKTYNSILEKEWSKYHKLKYSITVNSCTSALHVAFLSIGCKVGDEVLVPSLTPVMTANAIIFTGATPVFVDVDEDTFLMDSKDLERKITKKSKAILLVHMYGGINNSKIFKKISKKNSLLIVEDCAESLGAKDENGVIAGTMGDIACWSFQGAKHLTCGDGGIASTSNQKLAERVRKYSNLGFKFLRADADEIIANKEILQNPKSKRFELIGYNYRMNEFSAAVALAQFERVNFFLNLRRKIATKLMKIIKDSKILKAQIIPKKAYSTFYTLSAKLIDKKIRWTFFRKKFVEYGGDPIYAASKILQDEPSIKNSGLGRCFKTCKLNCKCIGTPIAKKLQKQIFNFTTNQKSERDIQIQVSALEKTLKFFKLKRNEKK